MPKEGGGAARLGYRGTMRYSLVAALLLVAPAIASAQSSRDALTQAVFASHDKAAALAQLSGVEAAAVAALAKAPGDGDAALTRALATSYRAKLTHNRGDALSARTQLEALLAKAPRDPEVLLALGAWHLSSVDALGALVARGALGARKDSGLGLTERAIALGGNRAAFPGLAGLLRLALDPKDARAPGLIDAAAKGSTPTALDRAIQRRAVQMQAVLKGGDAKLVQSLAKRLLPLGQFK